MVPETWGDFIIGPLMMALPTMRTLHIICNNQSEYFGGCDLFGGQQRQRLEGFYEGWRQIITELHCTKKMELVS